MKCFLSLLSVLFYFSCLSQDNLGSAIIITNEGDSLHGAIDYRVELISKKICRFYQTNSKTYHDYSPKEIKAFRFEDSKYFITKELYGDKVFLEILILGELTIYYYNFSDEEKYFLENDEGLFVELKEENLNSLNEGIRGKKKFSTKFQKTLKSNMPNSEVLDKQIRSIKTLNHQNLIRIVEAYHERVLDSYNYEIFEDKGLFKVSIEPVIGSLTFNKNGEYLDKTYLQSGLIFNINSLRGNEKIFFRTGFLYSKVDQEKNKEKIYRVPFLFSYHLPVSILTAKAGIGVNLYNKSDYRIAFLSGLNINIIKTVAITLNYDVDFDPSIDMPFVPGELFSNSFSIGVLIKL